ncbi:SCS3 (YGL126W) [Zygosaccharomyces parabailii]|nr:SCS3 (YGL126W) [Zygosaccharomyces parabailii]
MEHSKALRLLALFLCPATLLLGHILGLLYPVPSWIDKDDWINTFFVKKGWFWTSVVMWWCAFRYRGWNKHISLRYVVLSVWWFVFTQAAWFHTAPVMDLIFTATGGLCGFDVLDTNGNLNQKFQDSDVRRTKSLDKIHTLLKKFQLTTEDEFLSNLADHSLKSIRRLMGLNNGDGRDGEPPVSPSELNIFIHDTIHSLGGLGSSAACRAAGGQWTGGHDPSGHIFLNTLMIMLLLGECDFFENLAWPRIKRQGCKLSNYFTDLLDNSPLRNVLQRRPQTTYDAFWELFARPALKCFGDLANFSLLSVRYVVWENPVLLLFAFVFLWWYSFLMTTLVFHTLSEQLSGLLCAYVVSGGLYLLTIRNSAKRRLV